MSVPGVDCYYCDSVQPVVGGDRCGGCGMPVQQSQRRPAKSTVKRKCPKCSGMSFALLGERFVCRGCSSVFEDDDFSYLDTRPVENAMKRERVPMRRRRA